MTFILTSMQIDDILKAAIQDSGLEFFNQSNYSPPSSHSSESSLTNLGLDDDFSLTDLDWNLLDQSTESPPTSISPSQCSSQHPSISETHINNQLQTEDTDPFILALQELDDHNSKLQQATQQQQYKQNENSGLVEICKKSEPVAKSGASSKVNDPVTNAKSSDLLSLINYRASSVVNKPSSQVFEVFKFNRGWKTRLWCLRPNARSK